jgi:superfamily II DNA or RNA helicase
MIVMPTGTGKTETFLNIAHNWPQGHVLVMAHREELIWQPWRRWKQNYGEYGDIEMAEYRRPRLSLSNITFASKDTLYRERRLKGAFPDPKKVGLIIIDEAHHAVRSNKGSTVIRTSTARHYFAFTTRRTSRLTATPTRRSSSVR